MNNTNNQFCKKCGNQLTADADFCPKCGNKVDAGVQPSAPQGQVNNSNQVNNQNITDNINNVKDNVNSKLSVLQNGNNKTLYIVIIVIVLIVLFFMLKGCSGGTALNSNRTTSYLPKSVSSYDGICTKSSVYNTGMTLYETWGLEEMSGYISYSYVQVISKDDGSTISQSENNKNSLDELISNLKSSGFLGVTGEFKDGNIVITGGISNYSYSKVNDAFQDLSNEGYTCK